MTVCETIGHCWDYPGHAFKICVRCNRIEGQTREDDLNFERRERLRNEL